ncbi:unnamed protein product [Urochloa decumbens]|uniref:VQ domain-containing protein n=1 Tax=Urochloa decumbens TaxID=240449 RepID=A0ABC9CMM8_9POAL
MDRQQHHVGGGVKVTYIETQFVTSDAAGFKDLVQRLTGRSPAAAAAPAPAAPEHRPGACRAEGGGTTGATAGGAWPQGNDYRRAQPAAGEVRCPSVVVASGGAPPCQDELLLLGMMDDDFSDDLFYVGAGDQWRHGSSFNGGYSDLLY